MARFLYDQTRDFAGSALGLLMNSTSIADYNPHKQRPVNGPYVKHNPYEMPTTYLTKLEDIDQSWVHQYFKNVVVGLKLNASDSIKSERKKHGETRVFEDSEGDLVEESELLVERPAYTYVDVLSWQEKIPYLLKRIHEKSKQCGISIMSLLIAYERVLKANMGREPKPSAVLAEGVYRMSKFGVMGNRVVSNKGPFHDHAFKWIRKIDGHDDSYLRDAMELLDICERRGIDIRKEDPAEYQEDYIQNLVVLYVTKNRDLLSRNATSHNPEVLKELKKTVLGDYGKRIEQVEKLDWSKIQQDKIQKFLDSTDKKIDQDRNAEDSVIIFMALMDSYLKKDSNIAKKRTRNSFYLEKDNRPFLVEVTPILLDPVPDRQKEYALISSSGYLILVTNSKSMFFLDIETANEYMADLIRGSSIKGKTYGRNQKFGKWEDTLL